MAVIRTRRVIYSASSLSVPTSVSLGVFDTGAYVRLAGLFSTVSSVSLGYRMGITSGQAAVSSAVFANSGGSTFEVVNYGMHTQLWLSSAASHVIPALMIYGESSR